MIRHDILQAHHTQSRKDICTADSQMHGLHIEIWSKFRLRLQDISNNNIVVILDKAYGNAWVHVSN